MKQNRVWFTWVTAGGEGGVDLASVNRWEYRKSEVFGEVVTIAVDGGSPLALSGEPAREFRDAMEHYIEQRERAK